MMKKGFTLVELLGVFTIMASIMLVSVPIITGMMRKSEDQKYAAFKNNAFLSAEAYIIDNIDSYPEMKTVGGYSYISFKRLIENNYMSSTVYDPKTGKDTKDELDYTVVATVLSNYTYSYTLSTVKLVNDPEPPVISSLVVSGKVASFTLNDNYELEGYAVTTTTDVPTVWNSTGSVIKYSNTYTAGSAGTYYLHIIDYKGNKVYTSFTIPPLAPTVTGTSTIWTKSKTLTIIAPFDKNDVLRYEYIISNSNVVPGSTSTITGSTSISGLAVIDSGKYIFLRTVNKNGTIGPWGSAENLYVDANAPIVLSTTTLKDTEIKISDDIELTGYTVTTSKTEPTTWTVISGTSVTKTYTAGSAGTYYAWAKDIVGNTSYKSFVITPGALCSYAPGKVWTFGYTGALQNFAIPCDGTYKINVAGGNTPTVTQIFYCGTNCTYPTQFSGANGGLASAKFNFVANENLKITVGNGISGTWRDTSYANFSYTGYPSSVGTSSATLMTANGASTLQVTGYSTREVTDGTAGSSGDNPKTVHTGWYGNGSSPGTASVTGSGATEITTTTGGNIPGTGVGYATVTLVTLN